MKPAAPVVSAPSRPVPHTAIHKTAAPAPKTASPTPARPKTPVPGHKPPPPPQSPPQSPPPAPPPGTKPVAATPLERGTTTCNGTYGGTGKNVIVPAGGTCVLQAGTVITHDLTVQPGGRLIDPAVTIRHDLVAHSPAGIAIIGDAVGHDLRIDGVSSSVSAAGNYICGTRVGHDLVVEGGLSSAGQFLVGGGCAAGGNTVGHDLVVAGNANPVAVAGNSVGHETRLQVHGWKK